MWMTFMLILQLFRCNYGSDRGRHAEAHNWVRPHVLLHDVHARQAQRRRTPHLPRFDRVRPKKEAVKEPNQANSRISRPCFCLFTSASGVWSGLDLNRWFLATFPNSSSQTRLIAVCLGIVSSVGITMLVGLYFTTMHGIMPFLCLGESESSRLLFGMASFTTCLYNTYTVQSTDRPDRMSHRKCVKLSNS